MKKDGILKYIEQIVKWCIDDANIYIYAKCQNKVGEFEGQTLGGGNFAVPLITFSCIDLFASITAILKLDFKKNRILDICTLESLFNEIIKDLKNDEVKKSTKKNFQNLNQNHNLKKF